MSSELPARAVAVVGPTAAGKSGVALELAESLGLAILACDSVQVYRRFDVGSAKPSANDRARVEHHLIDIVDPDEDFSSGEYGRRARELLAVAPAIVCGGTGLYLRSLGWSHSHEPRKTDRGPEREAHEAHWLEREAKEAGAVHRALSAVDAHTAAEIHPRNIRRALRALWLCELAQEPISELRKREPPRTLVDLMLVVVDPGVSAVDDAIAVRTDAMLAGGWVEEVEMLRAEGYDARHKSMRSLGYREIFEMLDGQRAESGLRDAIVMATRHYARRQRTYFRHQFRELLPQSAVVRVAGLDRPTHERVAEFLGRSA